MAKPDYGFWAAQPEYSVYVAAYLCCDREPDNVTRDRELPIVALAMKNRLLAEVPYRQNSLDFGYEYIRQADLREWAEATGQRGAMPFLFPEDWEPEAPAKRTDPKAIEPGQVSEREEPGVLKVLGTALQLYYGDDILEDLTAHRSKRFQEVYQDIRAKLPIDEDTLRKYFKRIPWEDLPRAK